MTSGSTSIRIAILSDTLPPLGNSGIGNSHFHLIAALKKAGCHVRAYTFADSRLGSFEDEILRRGFPDWCVKSSKILLRLLIWAFEIARNNPQAGALALEFPISVLGALNGLRLILPLWQFRPDFIIVPDKGAVAAFWPQNLRRKLVIVEHSNPLRFLNQPLIGLRSESDAKLAFALEARMIAQAAAVVCPSEYMRKVFQESAPRYLGKLEVIPNLMDADAMTRILPASHFALKSGPRPKLWIYFPAASNINKGRQFVFEILRRMVSTLRHPVGFYLSGPLDPEVQNFLQYLPPTARVFAPGNLPFEKNVSYFKACHFCISPTLIENFGMALLEAQSVGLPVITFDVGGNRELVADGKSGYVVPYLDLEALMERSLELARLPARRKGMGEYAERRVARLFSSEVSAKHYLGLFHSLRDPARALS